ncbi:MAG: MFS transporter, partial [Myxococcales bacterium]|nr:MFS transporter [Myxococcales bacterium]
ATGTAIFKPGIQGTLVLATNRKNSSLAWGIFYQTVNIGGWMGPLVAARLRRMAWTRVFFANAGIICINFLLLLTYKEIGKDKRLERARLRKEGKLQEGSLIADSLRELAKPHVWRYLVVFAGFWFMFMSLFEVLVLYIKHWVDTRVVVDTLFGAGGTRSELFKSLLGMNDAGTQIQPAGLLNLNAFSIMLTCFLFAQLSARMRATTSIVVGCLMATCSMFIFSSTPNGLAVAGGILLFSVGEMLSSPKFNEFMGNFAPPDKKAMYLGFSQLPIAAGWGIEAQVGFRLYGKLASRGKFSRQYLEERGVAADAIKKIKRGEAFDVAVQHDHPETRAPFAAVNRAKAAIEVLKKKGVDVAKDGAGKQALAELKQAQEALAKTDYDGKRWTLARKLFDKHRPSRVWYAMGGVGLLSALGLAWYGKWVRKLTEQRKPATVEPTKAAEQKAEPKSKRKGDDDE